MIKSIPILLIYIFVLFITQIYSLDTNINKNELLLKVDLEDEFIEKKKKIGISWYGNDNLNLNATYKVEVLANATIDNNTGELRCDSSEVVISNLKEYEYKWKAPKLVCNTMYSFLVTVEGSRKYGLSKPVKYYKNAYQMYEDINDIPGVGKGNDDGQSKEELKAQNKSQSRKMRYIMIALIILIFIIFILLIVSLYLFIKNKKTKEKADSAILEAKSKTESYSVGYTQDYDVKSDSCESELIREKLKQRALEIERKKVMESMKEKKRQSGEGNNYLSVNNDDVASNAFTNSNTDFSWHGMEVMNFPTPKLRPPSVAVTPFKVKKYTTEDISIEIQDCDYDDQGQDLEITPPQVSPVNGNGGSTLVDSATPFIKVESVKDEENEEDKEKPKTIKFKV